jgi:hypothetical protein
MTVLLSVLSIMVNRVEQLSLPEEVMTSRNLRNELICIASKSYGCNVHLNLRALGYESSHRST